MTFENSIDTFFLNYQKCFESFDLTRVRQCYFIPCQLTTPDRVVSLTSEAEFTAEFESLFSSIKAAGFSHATFDKRSFAPLHKNHLMVSMQWQFFNQSQQSLFQFCAIYHLHKTEGHWKIASVISHDSDKLMLLSHLLSESA